MGPSFLIGKERILVEEVLKEHLEGSDMPFLIDAHNGMAWRVNERLWGYVNGRLGEEQLANYLGEKLESADQNLLSLEEEVEYPESAAEAHLMLHTAFAVYREALAGLEVFLWGDEESEDEDDDDELELSDIMRAFMEADELALKSQDQITELSDPKLEVNWLS